MLAAPEATLGTLRELLTSHSNHLSELYASLGASEDVVPSKMRELHSALVSCIEEQSEQAKEEVAAVHKELEALQEELRALAGQLGTKLAPDPSDEPLVTTLANRREARQRLLDLRQERQNQAQQLVDSISELLPILDQSPPPLVSEKSLTLTRLKALQQLQSESQTELQRRADQLVETMAEAEGLQTDMDIEPDAVFLSLCAPDVQPTATNLEKAARLQDSLEEERSRREAFIQDTFDALFALWASMGVDEAEADGFVEEHAGITQECMDAYTAELDRMKQWRRENIGEWVRCEMLEVRKLQVALFLLPESALDDVMEEQVEEGSEEQVLEQLEEQKTDLQRQMDEKQKLLNMLTRYFSILQEAEELKASANDPNRLTGKGPRGDPGRLLREEKTRKRIAKEKPKLEADFLKLIPPWEAEHGPFMVHGVRFLDDLEERMVSSGSARKIGRTAGAAALRPQATGASNKSINTSSLSSGPIKRQQTGASHGSSIIARPPSPHKRARTQTGTSSSSIPTPGTLTSRQPLPSTWGLNGSDMSTQSKPLRTRGQRPSFKPRPSELSRSSRAPSSLFSNPRTVSSTSSYIGSAPEADEGC